MRMILVPDLSVRCLLAFAQGTGLAPRVLGEVRQVMLFWWCGQARPLGRTEEMVCFNAAGFEDGRIRATAVARSGEDRMLSHYSTNSLTERIRIWFC